MNKQMKILKEIAQDTGHEDFYNKAKKFGNAAAKVFGSRHRSQMTNLENIANSTLKVTDILDYIKKQVARSDKDEMWRKGNFGIKLKNYIEQSLRARRQEICGKLESVEENSSEGQRIYLSLVREFVSQLVVHYEYQATVGGEHDGSDN